MLLSAIAALGTQSRGAFLAIAAMALVLWTRSQRKLVSGILLAVMAVVFVAFMPASWEARMRTIDSYQQDASAMGRINAWVMSYNLANDRLTGGGFSIYDPKTFARYAPDPADVHAAHSIYFQTLGQHGYPGMILFCLMGAMGFWTARQVRREARARADTLWAFHLAGMIQVSMVGFAVGGAFLSLAYFDLPYNVLVMLIAARHWLREKRWETETGGAFGASVPVGRLPKGLVKSEVPPR
jgi:probable O-glycosylation ligase (exosortase A-associated)